MGARRGGQAPELAALPVQYADYTLWQHEVLGAEEDNESAIARQLAFWTDALKDLPDQIELPSDRPRPAVASHRGDSVSVRSAGGAARRSVCAGAGERGEPVHGAAGRRSRRCSPGWAAASDIPIGSPIAGRTDSALDDLVGFFVNTLVLRTDTSGNPSFRELIARVRTTNLAAYGHQDLPFERLVEVHQPGALAGAASAVPGDAGVAEQRAGRASSLPGLTRAASSRWPCQRQVRPVAEPGRAARRGRLAGGDRGQPRIRHRSVRSRQRGGDGARLGSTAGGGRCRSRAGDRQPRHSQRRRAPHHPARTGTTPRVRSRPPPCRSCSRRRWRSTPDAIAVVFEDAEPHLLRARCARQASWRIICAALGVGPEVVVGLCVERSPEMLVGLLGILKAGGAYLPLDPDYPPERLAFMLEDARRAGAASRTRRCSIACPRTAPASCASMPTGRRSRRSPPTAPATSARSAEHRLCHLHVGLHRNPEGRQRRASRHSQSRGCPDRALRHRIRCPRSSVRIAELRRRDLGDRTVLISGAALVLPTAAAQRRCVWQRLIRAQDVTPCDVAAGAADGSAGGPAARDPGRRRRGLSTDAVRTLVAGPADDQRLWPDRDDGLRDHERCADRWRSFPRSAVRLEHAGLCVGRRACSRCRPGLRASFTSRARGWRGAIWGAPG